MAATGKAPWTMYMVALLAWGVPAATSLTVQVLEPTHRDIHHHNASRASAQTTTATNYCGDGYTMQGYPEPTSTGAYYYCNNWREGHGIPATTHHTVATGMDGASQCKALCDADTSCTHYGKYGVFCGSGYSSSCSVAYETQCQIVRDCAGLSLADPSGQWGALQCEKASTPSAGGAGQASTPSAGGAGAGASAVGDPHLQNIHGERFDLMKAGKHVLINIPRGTASENSLLRVQADARRLGGQCADMYFQQLNITGSWAEAKRAGGYHYSASERDTKAPEWVAFGKVELKVVHGRTDSGLLFLNLYVKHLGRAGFAVGGLLGEDDHEDVSVAPESCAQRLAL